MDLSDGSLTLGKDVNDHVVIQSKTQDVINLGYGSFPVVFHYNAGDIYGNINLNTHGKISSVEGKEYG